MSFQKNIVPVVVGAIAGMMLIKLGEMALYNVYPLPKDIDVHNKESVAQVIRQMPGSAFIALLVVYAAASFIGGLAATLVAGRTAVRPAIAVGIVLTVAGMVNAVRLPNPVWFIIGNLFVYLPFTCLGYLAVRRRNIGAPQP